MSSIARRCCVVLGFVLLLAACGRSGPSQAVLPPPDATGAAGGALEAGAPPSGSDAGGAGSADDASGAAGGNGAAGAQDGGGMEDARSSEDGPRSLFTPSPSGGCGKGTQALGTFVSHTVHVTGATLDPTFTAPAHDRAFAVRLPATYDPARPYRVVYVAMGCGSGPMDGGSLASADQDSIYVGLAPPPQGVATNSCFDNAGAKSTDWEYFGLVASQVEAGFCVDRNREIVFGSHSGATLANMLGCFFSKPDPGRAFAPTLRLRGLVSFASSAPKDLPACGGPIAGFWMHDAAEVPPPSESIVSRDRVLKADGCADSLAVPWGTSVLVEGSCRKYTACSPGYPVVYCEPTGQGRQSNYSKLTQPAVTQFLHLLDAE